MAFVCAVFVVLAVLQVYFDTWGEDKGFLAVDYIKVSFLQTRRPER